MKKNRIFRVAAFLLIAVMITTCTISGTFAKYVTSDTADDTARVAKWGVEVVVTGDDAFGAKYNDAIVADGTKVVSANGTDKVLAPGTNGTLTTIEISGSPEVMVNVACNVTLTLSNWTASYINGEGENVNGEDKCPVVFVVTVDGAQTTFKIDGTNTDSAKLAAAVEKAIEDAINRNNVSANTPLAKNVSVTWAWAIDGNDEYDTALGDLAADGVSVPGINFAITVSATQVN